MRDKASGLLLFLMIWASLFSDIFAQQMRAGLVVLAGCCSWAAAVILVSRVSRFQKYQAGTIGGAGLLLMMLSVFSGSSIDVVSAISKNAALVSMIASVGFLRLIALSDNHETSLPVGSMAFFKTLFGVSVFGSVINISAPILFADRLHTESMLTRLASASFTRVFSGCSAWSPFFGGMAAVLIYVPGFKLSVVMLLCLPFAIIGFFVVCLEAWFLKRDELKEFRGYPVKFSSLWIPLVLTAMVVTMTTLKPDWSILTCISLSALVLTIAVLLMRLKLGAVNTLQQHIATQLPRMANELLLFLVAGLLAQGLAGYIHGGGWSLPAMNFGPLQAAGLLFAMILAGIIGVHPIVTVAGLSPLLLTMNPNVHLLAVTYLFAWSLGTSASPLSGTHLVFQGRYGINSWKGAVWNWPYVAVMFLVAVPMLYLVSHLLE